MPEKAYLRQMQALPLRAKVLMSLQRIREWYDHWNGNVYVAFSGGKDSTVLAKLVHERYPEVPLVFCNTGLEYPEVRQFAEKMGAEVIYPKIQFSEVISNYGYPIISKENAEAISIARRIRNGSESLAQKKGAKKQWIDAKREELHGERDKLDVYALAKLQKVEDKDMHKLKTGNFINWRRQAIAGTGEFSVEKKSIFNKQKYLPLCRDTQFLISDQCCDVMKKAPAHLYQRKAKRYPYIGTLTDESRLREQMWLKQGCNAYDAAVKTSKPMSFWLEQDVLHYIYENNIEIVSVYGELVAVDELGMEYDPVFADGCDLKCTGCERTGCVYCGFGVHREKGETRFQKLAKTHPKQYEYCMGGGQWVDNPKYDPAAPKMDGEWLNWNPKKIWVPSKKGLGMKYVFDECNRIYGKDFIRYE